MTEIPRILINSYIDLSPVDLCVNDLLKDLTFFDIGYVNQRDEVIYRLLIEERQNPNKFVCIVAWLPGLKRQFSSRKWSMHLRSNFPSADLIMGLEYKIFGADCEEIDIEPVSAKITYQNRELTPVTKYQFDPQKKSWTFGALSLHQYLIVHLELEFSENLDGFLKVDGKYGFFCDRRVIQSRLYCG